MLGVITRRYRTLAGTRVRYFKSVQHAISGLLNPNSSSFLTNFKSLTLPYAVNGANITSIGICPHIFRWLFAVSPTNTSNELPSLLASSIDIFDDF